MKTFNRFLVVALIALLAACGGAADRKTVYMNKGHELFKAENYEKARIEFQNALQIDPKDLDARFALAETMEKLENWQGAAGHYLAILGEKPDHRGALLNMGRLYLLSNADDKAKESAEKILAGKPDDVDGLTLLAAVKAKAKDLAGARELGEKAIKVEPNNPEAASLMASLLLADGKVDESIKLLKDATSAHPEEIALKINLARVYAQAGRGDEAAAAFGEVIKEKPKVLSYRTGYSRFLAALKRVDDAEQVMKDAVRDFPEDVTAKLSYIEFLSSTRSVDRAIEELKSMIAASPTENRLKFALGKVYEATNKLDDAAKIYEDVVASVKEGPELLQGKSRLAVVKARKNDLEGARKLVDEVLSDNPRDGDALSLRGTLHLNDGDAAGAIADLRTVIHDTPGNVGATRLLARAHLTNKENELAVDVLKQGIQANPNATVLGLDLANIQAGAGKFDGSLATLEEVLKKNPKEMAALESKFRIFVYKKDWDQAAAVAEQMKNVQPDSVKGYHFAGLVQQAKGNFEASIGEFQSALDRAPDAVEPLSQLVKSHLALKQKDQAVAKLKEVIKGRENHFVAHNLLGELYLADKKFDDAAVEFKTAIEQSPKWPIPYRNLATVYVATKKSDDAIATMKDGIDKTGGQPLLVTGLASYLEEIGKLDSAIEQYEEALKAQPNSPLAANNLAMLLIEYRKDEASWKRARELVTPLRNSTQPAFLDTVGWVEYRLGEYEQAVNFLEKATEAAPDAALMHYHLGMAYLAKGNKLGARDHLSKAVEGNTPFKGLDEAKKALADLGEG